MGFRASGLGFRELAFFLPDIFPLQECCLCRGFGVYVYGSVRTGERVLGRFSGTVFQEDLDKVPFQGSSGGYLLLASTE